MKDLKVFSDWDYKILEFVIKKESVTIEQIKNAFPKLTAIEDRIMQLSEPEYIKTISVYIPNSSVLISVVKEQNDLMGNNFFETVYEATDFGKRVLQDYKIDKQNSNKKLWLESVWLPILVTIATNLLIIGIKVLLPRILEWFSNSVS